MLSWIKKLFKKEEQVKEESVSIPEIEKWFEEKSDSLKKESSSEILKLLNEIDFTKKDLIDNVERMKNASLLNPNVTEREHQFMVGNRDNYVKNMTAFYEKLNIPGDFNKKEIENFVIRTNNQIILLNKTTFRSFQVLQHFFANETKKIAFDIVNIHDKINKISNELNSGSINHICSSENKINELLSEYEILNKLKSREKELAIQYEKINLDLHPVEEEIKKTESSKSADELNDLKKQLGEILQEQKKIEQKVAAIFSPLDKSMKKFNKDSKDRLLNAYSENPYQALLEDENFLIFERLGKISKDLTTDNLGIREDKKDKAINALNSITHQKIEALKNTIIENKENCNLIRRHIANNKAGKILNEFYYKKDALNKKLSELQKESKEIKDKLEKKNIEVSKTKKELEDSFKSLLKTNITITLN